MQCKIMFLLHFYFMKFISCSLTLLSFTSAVLAAGIIGSLEGC